MKTLTNEQIADLGWMAEGFGYTFNGRYRLFFHQATLMLAIIDEFQNPTGFIFKGKVVSKSELWKIMKMTLIID